jgi:hypothetical protein
MLFDAFICHASEDKEDFVRPLADALSQFHLHIWYDEFSLSVGDGLRRAIDHGLAKSRFGIVVLSPNFFKKGWAQRELDGLVARQILEDRRIILPVWHNVNAKDIAQFSPPLADTVASQSSRGVAAVCADLIKKLRPEESPLIAARDELLRRGIEPPVISDEWWLDVVEASNRMSNGGAYIPDEVVWGPWSFPLPHAYSSGTKRGLHLAWTALQIDWSRYAEESKICQITPPERVHEFIDLFPGLKDICLEFPKHVACYAPQLTIPEFSGFLSTAFDGSMTESIREHEQSNFNGDIRTRKFCDEEWSLRHPTFGNYAPTALAHFFIQGEMFAPKVTCYEIFEYIVWLLSKDSAWLPVKHRECLISGTVDWAVWPGLRGDGYNDDNEFLSRLSKVRSAKNFRFTQQVRTALQDLITAALAVLRIHGDPLEIANSFIERQYVEGYYRMLERRRTGRA